MIEHEHVTCTRCGGSGSTERVSGLAMRKLREDAGLTLRQVAKKLGVSIGHLSDMELGNRTMSDEVAEQVVGIVQSLGGRHG